MNALEIKKRIFDVLGQIEIPEEVQNKISADNGELDYKGQIAVIEFCKNVNNRQWLFLESNLQEGKTSDLPVDMKNFRIIMLEHYSLSSSVNEHNLYAMFLRLIHKTQPVSNQALRKNEQRIIEKILEEPYTGEISPLCRRYLTSVLLCADDMSGFKDVTSLLNQLL